MARVLKIHKDDNVAVALEALKAGETFCAGKQQFAALEDVPAGHKVALADLKEGDAVIKYGCPIGRTKTPVKAGQWIHIHNIKTGLGDLLDYTYEPAKKKAFEKRSASFMGFERPDGQVGVRNEIWIIPTVGCVNGVAAAIERSAQIYKTGTIDAIAAFPHPYGCSQMGGDQENTRKILADLIKHPNAGGVLVLGLGCENSNIDVLKRYIGSFDENRVKFLVCQDSEDEMADALALIRELADYAGRFRREPISCRELVVGMKCGGSDGLSGITANPTVGAFSDLLISGGGSTILTEVPEMFGAETLLMNRCINGEVFANTVDLINDFKEYFERNGQTIYENPSPGNKAGGISTLEDKSLGCTQKSGTAPVVDVLAYGQRVKRRGLNLLSAPGNDLVAATALAASGAHIVLFTTGRGTPFACPVPTVKIASNSALAEKKRNWIDFDCGVLVKDGTPEALGRQLFDFVIRIASGEPAKSEQAGFHDMAIFKQGVTL